MGDSGGNDKYHRAECLRFAVESRFNAASTADILDRAEAFSQFVIAGVVAFDESDVETAQPEPDDVDPPRDPMIKVQG